MRLHSCRLGSLWTHQSKQLTSAAGVDRRGIERSVIEQVTVTGHDCLRARDAGEDKQVIVVRVAKHARRVHRIIEYDRRRSNHLYRLRRLVFADPAAKVGLSQPAFDLSDQSLTYDRLERHIGERIDDQRWRTAAARGARKP